MRKGQHRARAKRSTVDALMRVSLFFEESLQEDEDAYGVAVDLFKAYDNVPIDLTLAVCKKLGMNEKLLTTLRAMHSQITRRLRTRGFVGQAFKDNLNSRELR